MLLEGYINYLGMLTDPPNLEFYFVFGDRIMLCSLD